MEDPVIWEVTHRSRFLSLRRVDGEEHHYSIVVDAPAEHELSLQVELRPLPSSLSLLELQIRLHFVQQAYEMASRMDSVFCDPADLASLQVLSSPACRVPTFEYARYCWILYMPEGKWRQL